MDRIKRLSMQILESHKEKFGTDFVENKKILDNISIVRSKELKNELAGFITKFIKREIREKKEKEEQIAKEAQMTSEKDETIESSEKVIPSTADKELALTESSTKISKETSD